MPQSESAGNYKTIFYMPVVAPLPSATPADPGATPPPFTDPNTNYAAVFADPAYAVTEESDSRLKVALPTTANPVLLSTSGGFVSFVPKGETFLLPDDTSLAMDDTDVPAGAGTLVLQTWGEDYAALRQAGPSGEEAVQYVLYQNVNTASVKTRLKPFIEALPTPLLAKGSNLSPDSATPAQMADAYADRLAQGQVSLFVRGGTPLGEVEPAAGATAPGREFVLQSRDETGAELPLLPFLLSMQARGTEWAGHPLSKAAALIEKTKPVSWHLQFRRAQPSGTPTPLAHVLVRVMCKRNNTEEELHHAPTDENGYVKFEFDKVRELYNVPGNPDDPDDPNNLSEEEVLQYIIERHSIFFIVEASPDWSTWGWNDASGLLAYYSAGPPNKIGKATQPKVIQAGLDYHVVFKYMNWSRLLPLAPVKSDDKLTSAKPADKKTSLEPAPENIPVKVYASGKEMAATTTNANGEIHGVLFNIKPDRNITFRLVFDIAGAAGTQDTIKVFDKEGATFDTGRIYEWDTEKMKGGLLANYQETSIPFNRPHAKDVKTLHEVVCADGREGVDLDENTIEWALFFVKTCAEVEEMLKTLTAGSTEPWKGFGPLKLHLIDPLHSNGRSDVFGNIYIEEGRFNRVNLIHELFHVVMWRVFRQDPSNLLSYGDDYPEHSTEFESDEVFALTEAWPSLWIAAFDEFKAYRNQRIAAKHPGSVFYKLRSSQPSLFNVSSIATDLQNNVTKPFASLAPNEGEKVEGIVANSMLELLWLEVAGKSNDADCSVPQRVFANSTAANTAKDVVYRDWLNTLAVKKRFAELLWLPLVDLGQIVDFYVKKGQLPGHEPTTSDFLFNVLSRVADPAQRAALRQSFQTNFMAQDSALPPTIDSFYQFRDPDTGTVKVEILGSNFTVASTVNCSGSPVKLFGCSHNRLLATIPDAAPGTTTTITVQTQTGLPVTKTYVYE